MTRILYVRNGAQDTRGIDGVDVKGLIRLTEIDVLISNRAFRNVNNTSVTHLGCDVYYACNAMHTAHEMESFKFIEANPFDDKPSPVRVRGNFIFFKFVNGVMRSMRENDVAYVYSLIADAVDAPMPATLITTGRGRTPIDWGFVHVFSGHDS